jgi:hypothetical protein
MKIFLKDLLSDSDCLAAWDIEYFRHLIAEWNLLNISDADEDVERISTLIERFRASPSQTDRGDILELEQTLVRHLPIDALIQMAPILRLRYQDVVGDRQYAVYQPAPIPPFGSEDPIAHAALVEDLTNLYRVLHWRYVLAPFRDRVRTLLTQSALRFIFFYTLCWIAVVVFSHYKHVAFFAVLQLSYMRE